MFWGSVEVTTEVFSENLEDYTIQSTTKQCLTCDDQKYNSGLYGSCITVSAQRARGAVLFA